MKAKEIMKQVKELNVVEFVKFKKEFYKYVSTVAESLAEDNGEKPVKEEVVKTEVVKEEAKSETVKSVEKPAKEEPVKTESKSKGKSKKTKYNNNTNRMAKKCQYKKFFRAVSKTGYEHGDEVKEDKKLLAVGTKDSDKCVAAALVNHRGIATNVIYSPTYKYPMVFAKTSLEELEATKKLIMSQFNEDDDITKIGRNKKWNGKDSNLYYDEIEDGNFCYRMKDHDENIIYGGYIVDLDIAFYKTTEGTAIIDMQYFFMPRWGTFEIRENYEEIVDNVEKLIDRAFSNNDRNDDNKETVTDDNEVVSDDNVQSNDNIQEEKTVEDGQEEVSAEVKRQQRMQRRLERGRKPRVETKSKFSKPER